MPTLIILSALILLRLHQIHRANADSSCPKNCRPYEVEIHCNKTTGECSEGCKTGFYGLTCDKTCRCGGGACAVTDGSCMTTPSVKPETISPGHQTQDCRIDGFVAGICVLCAVVVVLIVVVAFLIVKFRRFSKRSNQPPSYRPEDQHMLTDNCQTRPPIALPESQRKVLQEKLGVHFLNPEALDPLVLILCADVSSHPSTHYTHQGMFNVLKGDGTTCQCNRYDALYINTNCLGLKVKLKEGDAAGGRGQTEYIYVMDRGMTSDKEASLRSLSTDPRRQTKGMTTNFTTPPTRQTTRPLQQTKKSKPCGSPPTYLNAVIKSTTGEKTVYSCNADFICCETQMTRSCLPTGEWETGIVECVRTVWGGPFGRPRKRFKQDFPCGPTDGIAVVIHGMIIGKSMKCYVLRNSDVLFYMAYKSIGNGRSVNIYSAKLYGAWKAMKQMPGIIPFGRNVLIKIYLIRGMYSVEIDYVVQHELVEAEKGGMPTSFLIQNDIEIFDVRFENVL